MISHFIYAIHIWKAIIRLCFKKVDIKARPRRDVGGTEYLSRANLELVCRLLYVSETGTSEMLLGNINTKLYGILTRPEGQRPLNPALVHALGKR